MPDSAEDIEAHELEQAKIRVATRREAMLNALTEAQLRHYQQMVIDRAYKKNRLLGEAYCCQDPRTDRFVRSAIADLLEDEQRVAAQTSKETNDDSGD